MKKICPTCKRLYLDIDNYCTKCGIELQKEPNRCSGMKTAICKSKVYGDDDRYCSICGSPTIYAKDMLEEIAEW